MFKLIDIDTRCVVAETSTSAEARAEAIRLINEPEELTPYHTESDILTITLSEYGNRIVGKYGSELTARQFLIVADMTPVL